MLSSLTCSGWSAWNSGLNPLKSVVRSSAGLVCSIGMVSPASSGSASTVRALLEREVAVADQVEEPDLGARGRGQRDVGLDPERHQRLVALVVLDLLDLADADAGDPDVVALLEHRRGGEDRLVLLAGAEADVAHDRGEQAGDQDRDDGEDAELDAGRAGRLRRRRSAAALTNLRQASSAGRLSASVLLTRPSPPRTTGP